MHKLAPGLAFPKFVFVAHVLRTLRAHWAPSTQQLRKSKQQLAVRDIATLI